ncbi:ankyrin repeat domain-containing protein [Streptomyces sp. NPDC058646]|uniref:ankyrin repeat domain-containing protein n=1 Tax=Streptomyces sp. NPDC058646 TaxID=3346574 RepID=UPI00364C194C
MSRECWTPAHWAVENEDADAVGRLLAEGADPDEVCHGTTLLTHAIEVESDGALQNRRPLSVRTTAVLLAHGANPELADPDGDTPLDLALYYGHDLAVDLLHALLEGPGDGGRAGSRVVGHLARPHPGPRSWRLARRAR